MYSSKAMSLQKLQWMVFFLENITIEQSQFKSNEDNSQSRLPSHPGCICWRSSRQREKLFENVTCRLCTAFEDGRPTSPAVLYCADVQLVRETAKPFHHYKDRGERNVCILDQLYWDGRHTASVRTTYASLALCIWPHTQFSVHAYLLAGDAELTINPADINDHLVAGEFVLQATQRIAQPFSQTLMDQHWNRRSTESQKQRVA